MRPPGNDCAELAACSSVSATGISSFSTLPELDDGVAGTGTV
jgi:hypothetical protein